MINKDQEQLKRLLPLIANRDERAFKQLFDHFYNDLVNYAYTFLLSRSAAEDIVSELMLKIWNLEDKISEIDNIQFYLYKSVRNRAINTIQSESKLKTEDINELEDLHFLTPETILIGKESAQHIQQAIDSLPLKCRTVFIMIRDNQMTYQEVADMMEISVHTVNRHMQDALHKLYDKLIK